MITNLYSISVYVQLIYPVANKTSIIINYNQFLGPKTLRRLKNMSIKFTFLEHGDSTLRNFRYGEQWT